MIFELVAEGIAYWDEETDPENPGWMLKYLGEGWEEVTTPAPAFYHLGMNQNAETIHEMIRETARWEYYKLDKNFKTTIEWPEAIQMKEYFVVVVNSDSKDTFAAETIKDAIAAANPDLGDNLGIYLVKAKDAGAARLSYKEEDRVFDALWSKSD